MRRASNPDGAGRRALGPEALVLGIERLEYSYSELMLRLCLRLAFEPPTPAHPMLLVRREAVVHSYPALLAYTAHGTSAILRAISASSCGAEVRNATSASPLARSRMRSTITSSTWRPG